MKYRIILSLIAFMLSIIGAFVHSIDNPNVWFFQYYILTVLITMMGLFLGFMADTFK